MSTQSGNDPKCDAQPNADYTPITSQGVTFGVNEKSATVTVLIEEDNDDSEEDEEFELVLVDCSGSGISVGTAEIGFPQKTTIWIKNTCEKSYFF